MKKKVIKISLLTFAAVLLCFIVFSSWAFYRVCHEGDGLSEFSKVISATFSYKKTTVTVGDEELYLPSGAIEFDEDSYLLMDRHKLDNWFDSLKKDGYSLEQMGSSATFTKQDFSFTVATTQRYTGFYIQLWVND